MNTVNKLEFPKSTNDTLLQGLTLQDLINAVVHNELVRDEKTVTKVFQEIIQETLINTCETLEENMDFILQQIKKQVD